MKTLAIIVALLVAVLILCLMGWVMFGIGYGIGHKKGQIEAADKIKSIVRRMSIDHRLAFLVEMSREMRANGDDGVNQTLADLANDLAKKNKHLQPLADAWKEPREPEKEQ